MLLQAEDTCSLIVMSCSICSIWSLTEALASRPGTTMSCGSADGSHLEPLVSIGLRSGAIVRVRVRRVEEGRDERRRKHNT